MVLCNQLVIQNTSKQVTMDRLKNTGLVLILCYKYGENSNGFSLLYESRFLQRCNTHIPLPVPSWNWKQPITTCSTNEIYCSYIQDYEEGVGYQMPRDSKTVPILTLETSIWYRLWILDTQGKIHNYKNIYRIKSILSLWLSLSNPLLRSIIGVCSFEINIQNAVSFISYFEACIS